MTEKGKEEEKGKAQTPDLQTVDELSDVEIVEVTGRSYKDRVRRPRRKHGRCFMFCCKSLRGRVLLVLALIAVFMVVLLTGLNLHAARLYTNLDQNFTATYAQLVATNINDEQHTALEFVSEYAQWPKAIKTLKTGNKAAVEAMMEFELYYENGTWITGYDANLVVVYDKDFNVMWKVYYPPDAATGAEVGTRAATASEMPTLPRKHLMEHNITRSWKTILIPDNNEEPFIFVVQGVFDADGSRVGYIGCGRNLRPRLQKFAIEIDSCITPFFTDAEVSNMSAGDRRAFEQVVPGAVSDAGEWEGTGVQTLEPTAGLKYRMSRVCPVQPMYTKTKQSTTSYMVIMDDEEQAHRDEVPPILLRIDHPSRMMREGTLPLLYIMLEFVFVMVILCVVFTLFLDRAVLKPIVALTELLHRQTAEQKKEFEEELSSSGTDGVELSRLSKSGSGAGTGGGASGDGDGNGNGKTKGKGKRGKESMAGAPSTGTGTDSTGATGASGDSALQAANELGRLKERMEANAKSLRAQLDAADEALRLEQQHALRHKQAVQLLNLWCGRRDDFPGLKPHAIELRYEPTRDLDDLLGNPLAAEFLKSHCYAESTLENLWFVLDVSWLKDLEIAEANTDDREQRARLHGVAENAAQTIMARYVVPGAPQQINISADTLEHLVRLRDSYESGMFDHAFAEVKLMFDTDILPRFRKSPVYSAMSETLFVESTSSLGALSEYSEDDDTVSTAGSILTDDTDEIEGIGRTLAHAFTRIHVYRNGAPGTATQTATATGTTTGTATGTATTTVTTETTSTLSAGDDGGDDGAGDGDGDDDDDDSNDDGGSNLDVEALLNEGPARPPGEQKAHPGQSPLRPITLSQSPAKGAAAPGSESSSSSSTSSSSSSETASISSSTISGDETSESQQSSDSGSSTASSTRASS